MSGRTVTAALDIGDRLTRELGETGSEVAALADGVSNVPGTEGSGAVLLRVKPVHPYRYSLDIRPEHVRNSALEEGHPQMPLPAPRLSVNLKQPRCVPARWQQVQALDAATEFDA